MTPGCRFEGMPSSTAGMGRHGHDESRQTIIINSYSLRPGIGFGMNDELLFSGKLSACIRCVIHSCAWTKPEVTNFRARRLALPRGFSLLVSAHFFILPAMKKHLQVSEWTNNTWQDGPRSGRRPSGEVRHLFTLTWMKGAASDMYLAGSTNRHQPPSVGLLQCALILPQGVGPIALVQSEGGGA